MLALPNPGIIAGPRVIAPSITARTAPDSQYLSVAAYDITAGVWLYDTDGTNTTRQIYSLTKLLSALVVVDWVSNLNDTLTIVSGDLVAFPLWVPLQAGDVVTYGELLKAALLAEAGDAIKAAGRGVGDRIFAATGTGTSGLTRFVEALNAKAAALGLSITVNNPGGFEQFTNTGSARDCCILAGLVAANTTLQPWTVATTASMTITGPAARTVTLDDPQPYPGRASILLNHTGFFQEGVFEPYATFLRHNYVVVFTAPNGNRIAVCGLNSERVRYATQASRSYAYDFDRLRTQLLLDFPYLNTGTPYPPNDPHFSNVAFLLGGDGGSLVDESPTPETITNSGITFVEAQRAVGSRAMFVGTNNFAQVASPSADLRDVVNDADFTIELWLRISAVPTATQTIIGFWDELTGQNSWVLLLVPGGGAVGYISCAACYAASPGVVDYRQSTFEGRFWGTAWHHIVLQRAAGGFRYVYVNGQQVIVFPGAAWVTPTNSFRIGAHRVGGGSVTGWYLDHIDDIRITRNVARYPVGGWDSGAVPGGRFPRA